MKKPSFRVICLLLCLLMLGGCTAKPVLQPSITLPPASPGPEAPLGDAGLQHEVIIPLYLPSLDGQTLLTTYEKLILPRDQHPAQAILRALLSHEGNSRVQPLGGSVQLSLAGANPVELCGSVCTVNLSASALQLSGEALYTAALAITSTLCEMEDVSYVNLLIAGTPVAMDVGGNLPLGTLTAQPGQELPVLWEQYVSRRTPVGALAAATPLTATATLYFPLADGSGLIAEPRRLTFPGQHPQQQVIALLEALSNGADLVSDVSDMPDLTALQLFLPEISELESGGRRATLHLSADAFQRISAAGCDPMCTMAAITMTLTTFVPSLQQVCVLTGNDALTSLYSAQLGSLLFPGALQSRQDFTHTIRVQSAIYLPQDGFLTRRSFALPAQTAASPRALLLLMADPAVGVLPDGLTDADILGLSVLNDTLLINLSDRYAEVIRSSSMDQRLCAYSMVNTLCERMKLRRVRVCFGSETQDHLGGNVLWNGEFLYNPGMIIP